MEMAVKGERPESSEESLPDCRWASCAPNPTAQRVCVTVVAAPPPPFSEETAGGDVQYIQGQNLP